MKINFQKLMRVLPSLITVCVIISLCVIPAFAAATEVNIWEYANIQVDGLTKVVTIRLPDEWLLTGILNSGFSVMYSQTGNVSGFDLTSVDFANGNLKVIFSPLGTIRNPWSNGDYNGRVLNLADIPNGSVLSYSVSAEMQAASGQSFSVASSRFMYGNYTNGGIRNPNITVVPFNVSGNIYTSQYDYVLADNSAPFYFQHYFEFTTNAPSSRWIFRLDDFTITTTLDALKELQDSVDENNRILNEIKEQMNINNQNWQDFLDGKKEWQDIVDESTDKVEDAVGDMNEIGDALATIPKPDIDIDTLVPDELAGQQYLNYTAALARLWENPIISTVAYIMGCLLIFSYLLFGERG